MDARAAAPSTTPSGQAAEVSRGERFGFGSNWQRFLEVLDESRIREAEISLQKMLGHDLSGRSFLDIGSGSGLFSLAAHRLGAERIHSFDFDPSSVNCTTLLRQQHAGNDERWTVAEGSVLDGRTVERSGKWDVVYSWGVLHHTGQMWRALEVAGSAVTPGGLLYISIYNDQGRKSRTWRRIKRLYNRLPQGLRLPYVLAVMLPLELWSLAAHSSAGHPMRYVRTWSEYKRARGMSRWRDIVDWIGGYPFEVAPPDRIFDFYRDRGFELVRLTTVAGRRGCNEYLFRLTEGG